MTILDSAAHSQGQPMKLVNVWGANICFLWLISKCNVVTIMTLSLPNVICVYIFSDANSVQTI